MVSQTEQLFRHYQRARANLGTVWSMRPDGTCWPHRVFRQTATRVYFEGPAGAYLSALRAELDRDGASYVPRRRAMIYTEAGLVSRFGARWREPGGGRQADDSRAAFTALGLAWPATAEDVRRAFRELAKVAHPDGGGTTEGFIELRRNYEAALATVAA